VPIRFDWDEENADHIGRHGIDTEEAEEVFADQHRVNADAYSTPTERRAALIGMTYDGRVLHVVFTRRVGAVRVVTCREATEGERRRYRRRRR
jgi:uncharacterized DUF497 family protein